jgi:hypothetical protein
VRFRNLDVLNEWSRQAEVVAIHENGLVHAAQTAPWDLLIIDQPEAAAAGMTGAGTTVAVLDTGTDYTNATFGPCTAPGNPFGCKVVYWGDFCCNDGQLDGHGHGTNVAGIVVSVAPDARIAALKVLDAKGNGSDAGVLGAVNWTIANRATYNIVGMNLSLGNRVDYASPCVGSDYESPFANARTAGILTAVAAGNDGFIDGISSPACAPSAISVGATDQNDTVASFSNSASFLTMLAPGVAICAAGSCMSGTSQATPHVAGSAAVLRAAFPLESVATTVDRITPYGRPITDARNGIIKPRLDLFAASGALPHPVRFAPQIIYGVGSGRTYWMIAEDFNGDAAPDLAVSKYDANAVSILASHSGGLASSGDTAVAQPRGLASGDFDGDGHADLAVLSGGNRIVVLLGDGHGVVVESSTVPTGPDAANLLATDLNGDGALDLVVGNYGNDTAGILLGNGNGTFQQQIVYGVGVHPVEPVTGDFNRDGHIDIALPNQGSSEVSVLLGNGLGAFSAAVNYPVDAGPTGMMAADLDADGKIDLVTANLNAASISVLRGVGDGTFARAANYPVGTNPDAVAIGDLNGDGFRDIVVSNLGSGTVGVLLGNWAHTFQAQATYATITHEAGIRAGLVVHDLDGDGTLDVALSNDRAQVAVLLNLGGYDDTVFKNDFEP